MCYQQHYPAPSRRRRLCHWLRHNDDKLLAKGKAWVREYLGVHAHQLQEHKQHHVHVVNAAGERVPLTHCRCKENPKLCKSSFPRTRWLMDDPTVLCAGHIRRMGMALTGRRSMLGSLHGPMNHESLTGTHSAMLAVQTCNSDVQLPYRFPICSETHSLTCEEECVGGADDAVIVRAAQVAQDAQAGYACDYCNKRQPMAFNEIKECCKGLQDLSSRIGGERINYVGKRHASRLMSDAYGKGIVRGQVENTNLRVNGKDNAVTHAETFRTCQTETFFGREYMNMVELLNDRQSPGGKAAFGEVDFRNPRRRKITVRDVATLYGQRPRHPDVWYLSPYEFVTHWETKLLSYPLSLDSATDRRHHVRMTERGTDKLREKARDRTKAKDVELEPGVDYVVLDGGDDWLPYPDVPSTQTFRHTWIMVRRKRPKAPSFAGAPVPRHSHGQHQRAATIVMAYFHPWTLREADDDEHVRYAGRLRPTQDTWQDALGTWLDGKILCQGGKALRQQLPLRPPRPTQQRRLGSREQRRRRQRRRAADIVRQARRSARHAHRGSRTPRRRGHRGGRRWTLPELPDGNHAGAGRVEM